MIEIHRATAIRNVVYVGLGGAECSAGAVSAGEINLNVASIVHLPLRMRSNHAILQIWKNDFE